MALIWAIVGLLALACGLMLLHAYLSYRAYVREVTFDVQTKTMWHERIWDPDNEHG